MNIFLTLRNIVLVLIIHIVCHWIPYCHPKSLSIFRYLILSTILYTYSLHIFLTSFLWKYAPIAVSWQKSNTPWVRRSFRELILSTSPLMYGTLARVARPSSSCIILITINSSRRSTSEACGLCFPWTTFWGSYCSRQQLALLGAHQRTRRPHMCGGRSQWPATGDETKDTSYTDDLISSLDSL